ncbi:hypothetical protein [Pontimicrobium aquaticum]|uniref:Uncharacterized protein n=1 Tax=Pontimicrobium aquaticum TaxID=2565367 RepID=A0A4U0EIU8_9FLAO|nr:hypothetical protein [Pontimicrobium aquaticum]TJY31305.1 hypothetical protein E5167_15285 [Pontimicrobium aquaticum]
MNIKEFFDIEPIQKNGLLIFAFAFLMSYLQLFLFKSDFSELDKFDKIILSLSIGVCWVVSELPTYFFFMNSKWQKWKQKGMVLNFIPDRIVASFGFTIIFWMVLLTYIGFEFNMDLKTFVRTSLIVMFLKSLYWFIYFLKYTRIDIKKQNKKSDK